MYGWYHSSLLPPDVDEDADADPPKICLLDRKPFLGKRTNATTARYSTDDDVYDNMTIQEGTNRATQGSSSFASQAWVIGVDMAKKKLQEVNRLEVGRSTELFYATISSHLNTI